MLVTKAEPLSLEEAQDLTKRIVVHKQELENSFERFRKLVFEAYVRKVDEVLGYVSWEEYVGSELDHLPRWSRLERKALEKELKDSGMSTREIGATVGVAHSTVVNDLRGQNSPRRSTPTRKSDIHDQPVRNIPEAPSGVDNFDDGSVACSPVVVDAKVTNSPRRYSKKLKDVLNQIEGEHYTKEELFPEQHEAIDTLRFLVEVFDQETDVWFEQ